MLAVETKKCRICGATKPLTEDYFHRRDSSRDGFRTECRECLRKKQEAYNRKPERKKQRAEYDQHLRATNPEWVAAQYAQQQEWHRQNPEWREEYESQPRVKVAKARHNKNWRKKDGGAWARNRWATNAEYRAQCRKRHRANYADPIKRKAIRAAFNAWRAANLEDQKRKAIPRAQKRRAAVYNAEGFFTVDDIERIMEAQDGLCFYCGADITKHPHVDHYIPISRGGTNWPHNIRMACKPCNSAKGNKLPTEFLGNEDGNARM